VALTLTIDKPMIGRMVMSAMDSRTASLDRVSVTATAPALTEAQQEQACINAVKAGDANAFQMLVESQQSRVYHLALRMLGNEEEAQDATQDAFVQAYTHLNSYRPEWRFKTWIMSITSNLCIDRLRRRRIEPMSFSDHTEDAEVEFVSHEPQPDVVAVCNERRAAIHAMLQLLPAEDRGMVVMFYWGDMSYDEIAIATHSTVNAVKSRLFRARRMLATSPLASRLTSAGEEVLV
jgi:RNA polymerase sigma-70 factor (ECF subfamily)